MKKVLTIFSLIVIGLFTLSLFGWVTNHISSGDKDFGFLEAPVKFMYSFPDLFSQTVEEVQTPPKSFIPTPRDFRPVNRLDSDVIALITYYETARSRSVVLMNLKNDAELYRWTIENPHPEDKRIKNPLLFPERSLVYAFNDVASLVRIDSLSNIIWKQDSIRPHHSMVLDKDGDIWMCSHDRFFHATGTYGLNGRSVYYIDDYITKVDADNGRILFHKSVTKILRENNLSGYLLKSSNITDPLHINDVEPALQSTPWYRADDVFISSKNLSVVLHYRPSTNKVIQVIEGPFTSQHDVDILNDQTLVIFNNNYYVTWSKTSKDPPPETGRLELAGDFYSNIVRYDLKNRHISFIGDSVFRRNKIFTATEGLQEFIDPTTYFVEEQNSGVLWIIREDQVLYKNVMTSKYKGYHHMPNWTRIIKSDE